MKIKSRKQAFEESTCQKRKTMCEIYDAAGNLLARESNRCDPKDGVCQRLGVVQKKDNYDVNSSCNWTHCEINAIAALPKDSKPYRAVLYGHDFYCDNCENALKAAGVQIMLVMK